MKRYSCLLLMFYFTAKTVAAQETGDSLFDTTVHEIRIYFSEINYWDSLTSNKMHDDSNGTSTFIPATVMVDGIAVDSTGIQLRGHSSCYGYPTNKKPFELSFNQYIDGQNYDGLKSIDLNNFYLDPLFIREKLFLGWLKENGIYAPRANYVRLYLNDAYWGLYLMVERVNKTFCDLRFGNNDGNLFKGDHLENKCADLRYHQQLTEYFNCYDLKTNEDVNDWSDLVTLTDKINNTTVVEFHDTLENYLNTASFIQAWVSYNLFADIDAYPFAYQHNYYLYHNLITNKFEWIVWDVNAVLGIEKYGTYPALEDLDIQFLVPPTDNEPLCKQMVNNPEYRNQYFQTYCGFVHHSFIPLTLDSIIMAWHTLIESDVLDDTLKMFTDSDFDVNLNSDVSYSTDVIPALLPFIDLRSAYVVHELDSLGYTDCPLPNGINMAGSIAEKVVVYPNPFSISTRIDVSNWNEKNLKLWITDLSGKILLQKTFYNLNEIETGNELSAGFYLLKVQGKKYQQVIPIVKE